MAHLFTANSSSIRVNNEPVTGIQGLDYRIVREQSNVHGLGSHERIGVYYGASTVEGVLRVASADPGLDGLTQSGDAFQVVAELRHSESSRSVAFDECHMTSKGFGMNTGGRGETTYAFSATRVREEDGS